MNKNLLDVPNCCTDYTEPACCPLQRLTSWMQIAAYLKHKWIHKKYTTDLQFEHARVAELSPIEDRLSNDFSRLIFSVLSNFDFFLLSPVFL